MQNWKNFKPINRKKKLKSENRFDMVAFMLMHVKEPQALSKNWKNTLSVENINTLVNESIKIINEMTVSTDEKMRLYESIIYQKNALGIILQAFEKNKTKSSAYINTGTMFDSKQKNSTDYFSKIKAEYNALRASKTAVNSAAILPQRRAG